MLPLPRSGHFPARKMAAGRSPHLRERSWIFSSETVTAFLSFSDCRRVVGICRDMSQTVMTFSVPSPSRRPLLDLAESSNFPRCYGWKSPNPGRHKTLPCESTSRILLPSVPPGRFLCSQGPFPRTNQRARS